MCQVTPFTYPITGQRLERLKARNPDGSLAFRDEWAQWVRQENPALQHRLKHLLQGRRNFKSDTEDALARTWDMAMQKVVDPKYTRPDLYRTYLFWLARAAASEVMRKGGREQLYGGGNESDGDDDAESGVLDWLASRGEEDESTLRRAFDELLDFAQPKLTDTERTIVVRHLLDGQTFAEIAADLELPLGSVSTPYYRALKKVRTGLIDLAEPPLTERERKVFVLHHAEKLEFDQIAQALQLPLATVLADHEEVVAKIWQGLLGVGRPPS